MAVQPYLESDVKWLALDELRERDWQHLPRDQIEGNAWTGRPVKGRIDGITAGIKRTSAIQMLLYLLLIIIW